jgi:hypothetical protein
MKSQKKSCNTPLLAAGPFIKINNKPAEKKVVQMNYLFFCSELRNVG